MSVLKFSFAILLAVMTFSASSASEGARTSRSDREAFCRAKFRCNTNPYGHDYQGTICRIQLKQCLQWRPDDPAAAPKW
ncbi:MAG: hypothetical protein KGM42_00070 [Hyphomicrobiales bacterium]|nr:hypothetical protein [Hyphomicrobiales bacterium]